MQNKTIFITVFHSFISKNILNSGVLDLLLKENNLKIVIFVPENKEDFFKEVYQSDRVGVVGINVSLLSNKKLVKLFSYLSKLVLNSHYLWYKKKERKMERSFLYGSLIYWFEVSFTKIFSSFHIFRKIMRFCFNYFVHIAPIKNIFIKYKPDCLFATDIFDETDILFMNESRHFGIPILGMVRSWDNCYSKGTLRVLPDKVLANNETIKTELVEINQLNPDVIEVIGIPQYDASVNEKRKSRDEFMKEVGLSENKKTILFAPAGTILSDTDIEICQILEDAILTNKIKQSVQVLVRNHPNHPANLSGFEEKESFKIEYPGKSFSKNPKETELTADDGKHLLDTLFHSDIVIYTATTLGLDSLMFDKPQIIISFDGYQKNRPYMKSVRRYYNEDHMKKMIACGGVSITNSPEDMIEEINKYLQNPKYRFLGREKTREQQVGFMDGKSNERVAKAIIKFIH